MSRRISTRYRQTNNSDTRPLLVGVSGKKDCFVFEQPEFTKIAFTVNWRAKVGGEGHRLWIKIEFYDCGLGEELGFTQSNRKSVFLNSRSLR